MARPLPSRRLAVAKRAIPPIVALVVVVVGLVAISGMLPRRAGDGPVPTSTARVAVVPTPTVQTMPSGGSIAVSTGVVPTNNAGLIIDWQEASNPGLGVVLGMTASASSNGRVVVIGERTEDFLPAIWTSADGSTWQLADFPDAENNDLAMTAVTAGGPGFVAAASDDVTGAAVIYVSADGSSWQRVEDDDLPGEGRYWLAAMADSVVAFSDTGGILSSPDGRAWTRVEGDTALGIGDRLLDVTEDEGTVWALSLTNSADDNSTIDVWRTQTDTAWERTGTIAGSEGSLEARSAAGPDGLVVIAELGQGDRFYWQSFHSADGASWQPAVNSPSDITDILADDAGFVAVGHYNGSGGCTMDETENIGVTWTSADGRIWRQMPEPGWLGRAVDVLGRIGRTLVGVGLDWNLLYGDGGEGASDNGLAWTAELPTDAVDAAPPPEPTPDPTPPADCF